MSSQPKSAVTQTSALEAEYARSSRGLMPEHTGGLAYTPKPTLSGGGSKSESRGVLPRALFAAGLALLVAVAVYGVSRQFTGTPATTTQQVQQSSLGAK